VAPPSYRDYRLPRGHHGLSPERVAENQRWRLIGAASDLLAEERLDGLSSRMIAQRAGVSSHTFYEHFGNVDALLTAAFANAAQLLIELLGGTCSGADDPARQRRKALETALIFGTDEPGLVALMRIEVAVAIPEVGAERERLVARLGSLAPEGRNVAQWRTPISATLALTVDWLERQKPGAAGSLFEELAALLN
jgi:AcrR family transcriptional regulator